MPHPFFEVSRPTVIGHRGAAGTHPENTLAAFEGALAQGAQILESDIQSSADGVPVLLHDPRVDRVTERTGRAAELGWAELATLDAGHRFVDARGAFPYRDQGHHIPSLEQAFEHFPDARFNLEIKCPEPSTLRATIELVERYGRADRTLLTAGEDEIMRGLRSATSSLSDGPALGASLGEIVAAISSALGDGPMPDGVMALQIPADFGGRPLVTRALVEHAKASEVAVHVWTINELPEIEAMLGLGVDGIVTDLPGQMHEWLGR